GRLQLAHRVAMAPLTRFRNDETTHAPIVPLVKEYYAQRASVKGTLLISEATLISPRAGAYTNAPGIWSEEQIQAWREVTDAVHEEESYMYAQLWALGRVADPYALRAQPGGEKFDVVSSSPVALDDAQITPR
ncbi:alkene reductase, partial [Pseudomonas otitidis]|nr:alkene reductase [Pseudomonas otitidis]